MIKRASMFQEEANQDEEDQHQPDREVDEEEMSQCLHQRWWDDLPFGDECECRQHGLFASRIRNPVDGPCAMGFFRSVDNGKN